MVIEIRLLRDRDQTIRGLHITGHSGYSEYGTDIVCAAVSALCITVANGLERYCDTPIEVVTDDGLMKVICKDTMDRASRILMDTLVDGLRDIERNYPQHLRICESTEDL